MTAAAVAGPVGGSPLDPRDRDRPVHGGDVLEQRAHPKKEALTFIPEPHARPVRSKGGGPTGESTALTRIDRTGTLTVPERGGCLQCGHPEPLESAVNPPAEGLQAAAPRILDAITPRDGVDPVEAAAAVAGEPRTATRALACTARDAAGRPDAGRSGRSGRSGSAPRQTLRAVLVALACLAATATHAQQVRGPSGSLLATVTDDEVRSASGSLLYRLDGREVRDASGRLWLRTDGGDVRNASGSLLGRFDGREIRDASGRLLGRVEGEDVRDASGRRIGRVSGVSARQAALYFFFLR